MKKGLLLIFLLVVSSLAAVAQEMSRYKQGVLPNGMTYYIKHTSLQKGEVSFYLMQNVGSILEEDHENGLAHFLEHMAFNGTEHFPNGIMAMLKSRGINTFNASTSINETIYNIDNVPTTSSGLTDTCLLILKDWSNGILLKDKDINEERGVIIEEWRGRAGVARRMQDKTAPSIYNNSKYTFRNVIGKVELLENFPCHVLKDFYKKWYRPDLQAIVIVGDINEVEYEKRVVDLFSNNKMPENPEPRPSVRINSNDKPLYCLALDTENKSKYISLVQRFERIIYQNPMDLRKASISANMFNAMLKKRISRIKNDNIEEFLGATISFSPFVRDYNALTINIIPLHNKDLNAFEQVMSIWEDVRRNGFTQDEFEQQQQVAYEDVKQMQTNMDRTNNGYYVGMFRNNFFMQAPIADVKENVENSLETILELSVEDVNKWVKSWAVSDCNISVVVAGNDEKYSYLTEPQMLEIVAKVKTKNIESQRIKKSADQLIDFEVTAGTIVKREALKRFDAEVWTLSNGATVVYKNLKDSRGEFVFVASSKGGRSVVNTKDLPSLTAMSDLSLKSGIYHHDRNAIQDFFGGKRLKLNMKIDGTTEGIGGGAPTEHAELFFQMYHLMIAKPVFAKDQFEKYVQQSKYRIDNTPKTPMDLVSDSIRLLMTIPNDRTRTVDKSYIDEMNFDRMLPLYNERFSNAADFTYCIIGDISPEEALKLASKYIGSLPTVQAKKEKAVYYDFSVKTPLIKREFFTELPDNKAIVDISYVGNEKMSKKEAMALNVLTSILRNRYFEKIREQAGGTYGVNVSGGHSDYPRNSQSLTVKFETEKEKVDTLIKLVYNELELIRREGVTEAESSEILSMMKRQKRQMDEKQDVGYWLNVLNQYIERGIDTTLPSYFEEIVDTITPDDIRKVTEKVLTKSKLREIIVKAK